MYNPGILNTHKLCYFLYKLKLELELFPFLSPLFWLSIWEIFPPTPHLTGVCECAQSYLTLCDPMDCSLPGSSVHGILQAGVLEWVAIFFSRDLPDLGVKPTSPALADRVFTAESLGKPDPSPLFLRKKTKKFPKHFFTVVPADFWNVSGRTVKI